MNSFDSDSNSVTQAQLHALKNRLTVVKGLAQLLERQMRRDDWSFSVIDSKISALLVEIDALEHALARFEHSDQSAALDDRSRPAGETAKHVSDAGK